MTMTAAPPARRLTRPAAPRKIRHRTARVYTASGAAFAAIYALAAGRASVPVLTWTALGVTAVLAAAAALGAARRSRA